MPAAPDSALARTTKPDRGIVVALPIPGQKSEFAARPAQVYVPPAWFGRHHPQLPVIMLLHGTPGSPEDWTVAGSAQGTADAWASQHGGQGAIIVMPDINDSLTVWLRAPLGDRVVLGVGGSVATVEPSRAKGGQDHAGDSNG